MFELRFRSRFSLEVLGWHRQPNVQSTAETLRVSPSKGGGEPRLANQQTMGRKPERSRSGAVWPVIANKWRCVVNQKAGENFEVGNIWLPKQVSNSEPFG